MCNIINQDDLLTMLGISKRRLKLLILTKKFPAVKLGGHYVFLKDSVTAWLRNNQTNQEATTKVEPAKKLAIPRR